MQWGCKYVMLDLSSSDTVKNIERIKFASLKPRTKYLKRNREFDEPTPLMGQMN